MLLNKKPLQVAIVLYELALRGDRGLSSYRAYDNNFRVKRLAARIWDLQEEWGCKIETHGSRPATYYLKSVPPETIAVLARGEPELMALMDHYLHVDWTAPAKLMPIVRKIAESTGKMVRRYEGTGTFLEDPEHPKRCRLCGSGMGNLIQKDGRWEHDRKDPVASGFCAAQMRNIK